MKRKKYLILLKIANIIFFSLWALLEGTLIFISTYNHVDEGDDLGNLISIFDNIESGMFLAFSIVLSIVLIISLQKIRSYTKTLVTSGMIPDEKLLLVQEIAFLIASFCYMIKYPVEFAALGISDDEVEK